MNLDYNKEELELLKELMSHQVNMPRPLFLLWVKTLEQIQKELDKYASDN